MTVSGRKLTCKLLFALLTTVVANADGIAVPTPASADEWPADFDQFWQRSLAQLIPLEPGRLATRRGEISFPVTETSTATAWWQPGRDPSATPIVHLVESSRPCPNRVPKDHRAHLFVSWRAYDRPLADWYLGGLRQPGDGGLMVSVLTACQAIALVRTWAPLTASRVGIVGDGYGGPMALAAASLVPGRISFVIAHQPRPAFHRLSDGSLTATPAVGRVLREMKPAEAEANFASLRYYDAVSFAARVRRPTLITAGERDEYAPAAEARALYDRLTCRRDSRVLRNTRHRPSADLEDFDWILAHMAARAEGLFVPTGAVGDAHDDPVIYRDQPLTYP